MFFEDLVWEFWLNSKLLDKILMFWLNFAVLIYFFLFFWLNFDFSIKIFLI